MAESKLNFNVPLLSTRRMMQKTGVSVRRNKTNNFIDDHVSKTNDSSSSSVLVLVSETCLDPQVSTESASVPFTWEQAPGQRLKSKDFSDLTTTATQKVFTPPCLLPPGKVFTRLENSKVDDESQDDVFSDALDTLSPNDSFSVNHSVSGVSGGYGVVETTKKKPLKLSDDPQSKDFMLNRFLPAAKAMTVEQPHHYALNRKPSSFMSEPTIQIRDLVPEEKRQTHNRYDESIVPHQGIDDDEESEEDGEEDDEVSEYAYSSKRGCGMLPQLCFKDSLGMLNTVPGFKAKHNSSVTFPSHDQVKSSKVAQLKSRLQSIKKMAIDSVSKQNLSGKDQSPVHQNVGKKFNSESVASRSLSPYRHTRCMSPFGTTGNGSPLHPDTRKETENLRANRLNKHIRNISWSQDLFYPRSNGSTSSLLEKTVYVDTENSHNSNIIMITPEEEDIAGKKPDTNLELEAFKNISIRSDKMMNDSPDMSPLAPPSPKKPSESWLLHNLPSVTTSQVPSCRFLFDPRKQDHKENSRSVTNWETIVKTSYMHRDHIRYSEELVTHTSHQ